EIVEWRIAQYFVERSSGVRLEVLRNESGIPVLELDRNRHDLPEQGAWVDVEIEGQQYSVNFDEERVQVAVPRGQGSQSNALPDLMYKWFGRDAGARGTRFAVAQDAAPGGGYRWTPANSLAGKPSEGTFIRREDGTTVDARMFVEELDGASTVVVMSRGGGRNDQYTEGVELLLERLGRLGAMIERIAVESGATTTLDLEGRTARIDGFAYPIDPAHARPRELRLAIGKAVAAIGRSPGAKGSGNVNKRMRLWLAGVDPTTLERG